MSIHVGPGGKSDPLSPEGIGSLVVAASTAYLGLARQNLDLQRGVSVGMSHRPALRLGKPVHRLREIIFGSMCQGKGPSHCCLPTRILEVTAKRKPLL